MFSRRLLAWRRFLRRNRGMRIAVTIAMPVLFTAVVVVPLILAAGGADAGRSVTARAKVAPDSYSGGPTARVRLGDVATRPVDGTGAPISLSQTPAQAANSGNCTLIVPAHPLTAAGLATPYQLGDGCSEGNPGLQAFAEATILAPGGHLSVYDPLVITAGTIPAAPPVRPVIAAGSAVMLDFGFNGTNLVLTGPGAAQKRDGCVDALRQSVIGQVSACDAVPFFEAANAAIADGDLRVPGLGRSLDGEPCQDTRNFALVDQDPSDNTNTQYLLDGDGQTAQATPANRAALSDAGVIDNGSDNALLGVFVDPANGCHSLTEPDPTSASGVQSSLALNELSARVNQRRQIALVPPNDEMVLVGSDYSVTKTNVYRSLVDQPLLAPGTSPIKVAAAFCMNMVNAAAAHDRLDLTRDTSFTSAVPDVGDNLATFLGNRLSQSFTNLGCGAFGLKNPVKVTVDGDGVATRVRYDLAHQQATIPVPADSRR